MRIVLENERPLSWNKLYAGKHWSVRKTAADAAHALMRCAVGADAEKFTEPVRIRVTAYFKSRPLDADNICAKLYIDGLIGRILEDDSPKYVAEVTTVSRVDKQRPRLEIQVEPIKKARDSMI